MSNILMIPASGSIIFDSQSANSSVISPLSSAPRLSYDNGGGLNITSYTTGTTTLDRFSVDGSAGRLFSISDSLTGTIFSVNDAAGLPIIQVDSDTTDIVNIGPYGTNTFVTSGSSVGIGTASPISKLHIVDRAFAATGGLSGSILNLEQTWNTSGTPTAIKLNVTDTASNANSLLMDLEVSGLNRFSISKNGLTTIGAPDTAVPFQLIKLVNQYGDCGFTVGGGARLDILSYGNAVASFFSNPGGVSIAADTFRIGTNLLLNRDADNIFAQRNGVNPQAFRLYNTYTSSTNFERLNLRWDTNVVKIGTEKGSAGGIARDLVFETDATGRMTITSSGNIGIGNTSPTSKLQVTNGDIEVETIASGLILKSPDGTRYRVTAANGGTLSVSAV
jgi:hypothetical protein